MKNSVEQMLEDFGTYSLLACKDGAYQHLFGKSINYFSPPFEGHTFDLVYESNVVGALYLEKLPEDNALEDLIGQMSSLVRSYLISINHFNYFLKVHTWIREAKKIAPTICDWIGIYFKESYLYKTNSTDLVVGPYIGEVTEHVRIGLDRGLCGLALREERVINMADVHADSRHIACSFKTKSELIVPLKDENNKFIAELDIDSHTASAFTAKIEKKFKDYCQRFVLLEKTIL